MTEEQQRFLLGPQTGLHSFQLNHYYKLQPASVGGHSGTFQDPAQITVMCT